MDHIELTDLGESRQLYIESSHSGKGKCIFPFILIFLGVHQSFLHMDVTHFLVIIAVVNGFSSVAFSPSQVLGLNWGLTYAR